LLELPCRGNGNQTVWWGFEPVSKCIDAGTHIIRPTLDHQFNFIVIMPNMQAHTSLTLLLLKK
jgi:hypothetical protein